jgi:hypothetical protein
MISSNVLNKAPEGVLFMASFYTEEIEVWSLNNLSRSYSHLGSGRTMF